jgi:hypothetical protein
MKKLKVESLILKEKFIHHYQIKSKLLNFIEDAKDSGLSDHSPKMNDDISKLDWINANNWERPWVKNFGSLIQIQLDKFANVLGFKKSLIQKLWYQQYIQNDKHNWHSHEANYTGVYYLEFNKNNPTTQLLLPSNLNKSFTIDVEEGDFIFFPCHLIHRAPINTSKERKTIISFNIELSEILEEYLKNQNNSEILK